MTCHDGFTLNDLVSYDSKRNLANGENNQDGTDDNRSWNCGSGPGDDGPTSNAAVASLAAGNNGTSWRPFSCPAAFRC